MEKRYLPALPRELAALSPVERVARVAGSKAALAKQLGVNRATPSAWIARRSVPHKQALAMQRLYPDVVDAFEFVLWAGGHDDTHSELLKRCRRINAQRELAEASM